MTSQDVSRGSGRIFISYRREGTAYSAGWLYDRLAEHFGAGQVFKDVDSIELGDDFVEVITRAVSRCDVLLALIGEEWLTAATPSGDRRLDDPEDFVRLEIEAALARRIRVIPILVDSAVMPRTDQLPPSMAGLGRRQALELSPSRFESDTSRLLRVLDRTLTEVRMAQEGAAAGTTETTPGAASPSSAAPSEAEPAARGSAGPSSAGPSSAGPSSAGPSSAGPSSAGPSSAGPLSVEPSSVEPSSVAPPPLEPTPGAPTSTRSTFTPATSSPLPSPAVVAGRGRSRSRLLAALFAVVAVLVLVVVVLLRQSGGVGLGVNDAETDSGDGLRLSDLAAVSQHDPPRVGDTVTVTFRLTNVSDQPITLESSTGVFVAARNQADENLDSEELHGGEQLAPGASLDAKAQIRVDSPGQWKVWPCYESTTGACPDEWQAFTFRAN
jgi:hypothetical protein